MTELWQFIFSSFWVWLGTLILVAAAFGGIGQIGHVTITKKIVRKESAHDRTGKDR